MILAYVLLILQAIRLILDEIESKDGRGVATQSAILTYSAIMLIYYCVVSK